MAESLFSPSWYRVAGLKPRLRSHTKIHRHAYRDEVWYVLQDQLSGKYHRFSEGAYQVIGLMDGSRNVDEIWQLAAEELGDDSPTQEEMIRLLSQLHASDVLQSEASPDSQELFDRYRRQERANIKQRIWSPLAIRIKLLDPERFLEKALPLVRPVFSKAGLLVWLVTVIVGLALAGMHWSELTENLSDRVLAPQNLLVLWLVYPVVKAFHELGHAFATKVWGGEVHEIGIMFLVFMPVPYVDASAASAFREKYRRVVVGAIGIGVELFLAAIALFVWLNAELSSTRAIAYNIMLIGGVSTLFFNGNPLLRFDGYYVFADLIEIPNLGKRANDYIGYLVQRYVFRSESAKSPATTASERKWFVFYGVAAFAYRMFIATVIILFVAGKFFFVGILLAIWAATTMLVVPLAKSLRFLFTSPKLNEERPRAIMISGAFVAALVLLLGILPAPYRTMAEGVVWLPEQAAVRAGTSCFLREFVTEPDAIVAAGEDLIHCEDPLLALREDMLEARLRELEALYAGQRLDDRVAAGITREEIEAVEGDLTDVTKRMAALSIRAPIGGRLVLPESKDLKERFVNQGEILGYVVEQGPMKVRVAVRQDDVGLVREYMSDVRVQLADRLGASIPAAVLREVPGGTNVLPSAVLGKSGGGKLDVDPRDPDQRQTFIRVFEYVLELPADLPRSPAGTRAYVRFGHGSAPLGVQWYRKARQVFLGQFGF
jgi:putative peptide zinc metalloprotease protein